MRIGVNALYLIPGGVGGTEIYLCSLLAALGEIDANNEYVIFTNRETDAGLTPSRPNFRRAPQPARGVRRPERILWEQTGLPIAVAREGIDVLFNPGFTSPLLCSCPAVSVFHDLQHKRHPEHFRWFDLPFWRLFLFQSACSSEALIAVSNATREDLLHYYPVPDSKIHVIPHGVDEQLFEIGRRRQQEQPQPYLLCVSTLHPHKNLDRVIRSFAAFRRRHPEFQLVIAGLRGFHSGAVERQAAELGLGSAVRLTGWIPRQELYTLYLHADAFLHPSTFEGFGLPVLEAMAAGIPSACSAIAPLHEIAGKAALQFDPENDAELLEAMERITSDAALRDQLRQDGPRRASAYSWRKSAAATLAVLEAAASAR